MDRSGNVSIGKEQTTEKLSVNGKIRAKEIKVEIANWPDYVFGPSFELPSLHRTAEYIKKHGHLPNIPSSGEVENEGINLGEMNAKLLQKIEELTLHLIKQDEQINHQRSHILKQDDRLKKIEYLLNEPPYNYEKDTN